MKRTAGFLSILVIVVVAAWTGLSYYAGLRAESDIRQIMGQPMSQSPLRMTDLVHQRGVFDSLGEFVLHYPDPAATVQPRPDLLRLRVTYSIDHFVLPQTVFRFAWTAQLIDDAATRAQTAFGQNPVLSGLGQLGWNGQAQSHYFVPALQATAGPDFLRMSSIQGQLRVLGQAMQFDLVMPSLEARLQGELWRLERIALGLDLTDRFQGIGQSWFAIDRLFFNLGTATGFRLDGQNRMTAERLSVRSEARLAELAISEQKLNNVELQITMDDLDRSSLDAMSALLNVAGNLDNLTSEQQQIMRQALRRLILQGFSLGIPRVAARSGRDAIEGELLLQVKPAVAGTAQPFDVARQVASAGQLRLKGQDLPPALLGAGLMLGILVQTKQGFEAGYDFSDGKLVVNGRIVNATDSIKAINEVIDALIGTPGS